MTYKFHLFFFCFLLLNSIVISAWAKFLQFGFMRIDLLIPAIGWYALESKDIFSPLSILLVIGCIMDFLSGMPPGAYALMLPLIFGFIKYIAFNTQMDYWWQRAIWIIIGSFIFQTIMRTISGFIELIWPWGWIQALCDGIIAIFLFPMLSSLIPFLGQEDNE